MSVTNTKSPKLLNPVTSFIWRILLNYVLCDNSHAFLQKLLISCVKSRTAETYLILGRVVGLMLGWILAARGCGSLSQSGQGCTQTLRYGTRAVTPATTTTTTKQIINLFLAFLQSLISAGMRFFQALNSWRWKLERL